MKYSDYLASILTTVTVTDELTYTHNGEGVAVIVKYLNGTNYQDSIVQPIQLLIYTDDVMTTKAIFDTFTKTYNNLPYIDDFTYINQLYSTPMIISNFGQIGNNYASQIIVNGTLVISSNISDIKQVIIDGYVVETTSRHITYVAVVDNTRVSSANLNASNITQANIKITITILGKATPLWTKLRRIRTGLLDIDTSFTVALKYTDNDEVETYTMKVDSVAINSENQTLPSATISFIK